MQMPFHPQHSFAVQSLLEYLEKEYYDPARHSCARVLDALATSFTATDFSAISARLVARVQRYIRLRRLSLVPYLEELVEKEDTGHDCRSCSSSCTLRHTAQLNDVVEAHRDIRGLLQDLKTAASAPGESAGALLSEMESFRELLSEMIYLEETVLIPKIAAAQEAIHAHR